MGTGIEHEKATKICSLILALMIGLIFDFKLGFCFGSGFLIGGLWLSPDLDTKSKPIARWGALQIIWWPYRKLIHHRSPLSHGPIIGTGIRIFYLLFFTGVIISIGSKFHIIDINDLKQSLSSFTRLYTKEILIFIGAIELSAWLHIMQDKSLLIRRKKK